MRKTTGENLIAIKATFRSALKDKLLVCGDVNVMAFGQGVCLRVYLEIAQAQSTKGKRVICIGVVFARMAPCEGDGMEKLMGKNEKTCQSVNLMVFVLSLCALTSLCAVVFGSFLASKEHKNNS